MLTKLYNPMATLQKLFLTLKKKTLPSIIYTPEELVGMFFKWVDPGSRDSSIQQRSHRTSHSCLKKKHDIKVTNKPLRRFNKSFRYQSFAPPKKKQCNVVCNIPCATCVWNNIGKTGRSFVTRKKKLIEM